ncbi:MAG: hypothetical protein IT356_06535 [Gemmatimonadaceae bacterium]|nr:hypothetical protein [Gemmatimonadaceae bacterium]
MTLTRRGRRGSALVLVLLMTLALAGLAISAVLMTSSSALMQRYFDKEKDFRYSARAAVALVKSLVQRDTTVVVPGDTALRVFTGATIADAGGVANGSIRVNGFAAYTGDTAGTHVPFLTVMAQAYDSAGVRSVVREDMQSDAFSRYAMFMDSVSLGVIPSGQIFRGRVHGNRGWLQSAAPPGPDYYDTLTVVGSLSGSGSFRGPPAVTGVGRIRWPTTTTLAPLAALGQAGNLAFAPVSASDWAACSDLGASGIDLTGRDPTGVCWAWWAYVSPFTQVPSGTRLRLRPVDVNANGVYDAAEGFFEVYDLSPGIDTSSLRADISRVGGNPNNIVVQNQCGLMVTIAGRREFFPVARFREGWVRNRVQLSTAPVVSAGDAWTMSQSTGDSPSAAAVSKILSYGVGYSRCFPAGSPYLMLTERYVGSGSGCVPTLGVTSGMSAPYPYAWGAVGGGCGAAKQYGGQDTTFTPTGSRCRLVGVAGQCAPYGARLGSWKAYSGTNTASISGTVMQGVERPYLWPISPTYNPNSRGVAYASNTNPLYVSGALRGYLTLYSLGKIVLIDDVVYDGDPTAPGNLCRNFLGLIGARGVDIADNALNRPRPDPGGTYRFLGTPDFTLHGIVMSLAAPFTVEGWSNSQATSPALSCNGVSSSGGCINHTGGVIAKYYAATTSGPSSGLVENRTYDPCQAQPANRRPPYFPLTGRYTDYKSYELDTRRLATWPAVKAYLARLRGGTERAVP